MRVIIFAGTTGFNKSKFLLQLTKHILKSESYSDDLNSIESSKYILYIKFEDELIKTDNESYDISTFLDRDSFKYKIETIEKTFTNIGRIINSTNPNFVFLDIHLSYLKRSQFVPPLSISNFKEIVKEDVPVKIITLIDDIFVIHKNLLEREDYFPGTKLRLREILAWRSVELLQAEGLAASLRNENRHVKNYLVSIRHPLNAFINLSMKNDPSSAYLSFPISKTRKNRSNVEDINFIRENLTSIFSNHGGVLFDPVTIDELALRNSENKENDGMVILTDKSRWPINNNEYVDEFKWPIPIPREEIDEVLPDITNQIRTRDFKLIDNAKFTIVYRPFYNRESSEGVTAEINYTTNSGKYVYVLNPKDDVISTSQSTHPFGSKAVMCENRNEFETRIKNHLLSKNRKIIHN